MAIPLLRENIDTDAIIPSREMKHVSKKGLGNGLFANWRYLNKRVPNPDFVLNFDKYQGAQIILSLANFGCGSSREHAVWALSEYGINVIIAPSYGEIFYMNCVQNGVLPIRLNENKIRSLAVNKGAITVNLFTQVVDKYKFNIESQNKTMLLEGLNSIELTLKNKTSIEQFELQDKKMRPWVCL